METINLVPTEQQKFWIGKAPNKANFTVPQEDVEKLRNWEVVLTLDVEVSEEDCVYGFSVKKLD